MVDEVVEGGSVSGIHSIHRSAHEHDEGWADHFSLADIAKLAGGTVVKHGGAAELKRQIKERDTNGAILFHGKE